MEGNYPLIMHGKWTARLLVDLSNTDQNLQIKNPPLDSKTQM